jgi:DNA-binding NarL/FixJ family response regulator
VRVVIAEDLALLRDGLVRLLRDNGFEVVAAVQDGHGLVRAIADERPEIAIVDIRLPPTFRDEGLRAALEARKHVPETAILIVSQYVEHTSANELLSDGRGGIGYLLKDRIMDVDEFVEAVRRVAGGGTALDPEVVSQLLSRRANERPLERLTPREREVLALMAEGRSNAGDRPGARPDRRRGREARREHPPEAADPALRERPPARAGRGHLPARRGRARRRRLSCD